MATSMEFIVINEAGEDVKMIIPSSVIEKSAFFTGMIEACSDEECPDDKKPMSFEFREKHSEIIMNYIVNFYQHHDGLLPDDQIRIVKQINSVKPVSENNVYKLTSVEQYYTTHPFDHGHLIPYDGDIVILMKSLFDKSISSVNDFKTYVKKLLQDIPMTQELTGIIDAMIGRRKRCETITVDDANEHSNKLKTALGSNPIVDFTEKLKDLLFYLDKFNFELCLKYIEKTIAFIIVHCANEIGHRHVTIIVDLIIPLMETMCEQSETKTDADTSSH